MKVMTTIYSKGEHSWRVIARDPQRPSHLIDTNEYLVADSGVALIIDPGGQEIFPAVFSALCSDFDPRNITHIFSSHQDPDIISSLALWLALNPKIRCYVSWLWAGFVPHFGSGPETMISVPDEGGPLELGSSTLRIVPAHFLHSSGNLHLYDPSAQILFSGDVGAALLPAHASDLYVQDFDEHIKHARGFHQRWMGSAEAKRRWCERVSKLEIDMLCPQHGAIYRGRDVERFINWFSELPVGVVREDKA